MEKTNYKEYQKIIRERAWKKFSKKHGIPDIAIALLIGILTGIAWHYFRKSDDTVLISLLTLVVFLLIYSGIYLGYFAREHVFMHNQLQLDIDMLKNKYEFIENPFRLSARPPLPRANSSDDRSASLTIENLTPFKIEECFLTVDEIINTKDSKNILYSRQRNLSWSSGEGTNDQRLNMKLDIVKGAPRVCDIAESRSAHNLFTTTVWNGEQNIGTGLYEIVVTAHGEWKGSSMSSGQKVFVLEYAGENKLTIMDKKK